LSPSVSADAVSSAAGGVFSDRDPVPDGDLLGSDEDVLDEQAQDTLAFEHVGGVGGGAQAGEEAFQVVGELEVDLPVGELAVQGVDLGAEGGFAGAQQRRCPMAEASATAALRAVRFCRTARRYESAAAGTLRDRHRVSAVAPGRPRGARITHIMLPSGSIRSLAACVNACERRGHADLAAFRAVRFRRRQHVRGGADCLGSSQVVVGAGT